MNQYSCISLPQDPSMNPQAYPQYKSDFKYNAVFLRGSVPVNLIRLSGRMLVLIWNEVKPLLTSYFMAGYLKSLDNTSDTFPKISLGNGNLGSK